MADKAPEDGIQWAEKSTTVAGKRIWRAAVQGVDDALGEQIEKEKNWRKNYNAFAVKAMEAQVVSQEDSLRVARQALEQAQKEFVIVRNGETKSLADAMAHPEYEYLTKTVKGDGKADPDASGVSFEGKPLSNAELLELCEKLAADGCMEADVARAIDELGKQQKKIDDIRSKKVFVLVGATSELGPMQELLRQGMHVVAIARPGAKKWEAVIEDAKKSAGTLSFPVRKEKLEGGDSEKNWAGAAGADCLTECSEIARWVTSLFPEKDLVVGTYIYLDGELHVRATIAMDAILQSVCAARPSTAAASILSPSMPYTIPKDAYDASVVAPAPWWSYPAALVTGNVYGFQANARAPVTSRDTDEKLYVHDGIVNFQGPNYCLAKSLQVWRAALLRHSGHVVSANYAPPARTVSVMHSKAAATALRGASWFAPLSAFDAETVSPLMAKLLLHDLVEGAGAAQQHPLDFFQSKSFHGGSWRCPYKYDSIGTAAYLLGTIS